MMSFLSYSAFSADGWGAGGSIKTENMYPQVWEILAYKETESCSICLEGKQDELRLSCGHSFCRKCILEWFKEHHHNCPYCRKESGAISHLVTVLRDGSPEEKEKAAEDLRYLASNAEIQNQIAEAGAIPLLVTLLSEGTSEAKEKATRALGNLARNNQDNQNKIREAGAIPLLTELLKSNIKRAVSWFLRSLAINNAENKTAIAVTGALRNLASNNAENKTAIAVAGALRNLAINNAENQKQIAEAGVIPLLVTLLSDGTSEAKEKAAGALWSLASNTEIQKQIAEAGAIPLLVTLLSVENTPKVKEKAAGTLRSLAINNAENEETIKAIKAEFQKNKRRWIFNFFM